jgi:ubiquinone biosynthesis protein COQ9
MYRSTAGRRRHSAPRCPTSGADLAEARAACPRGAVDLALLYHHRGDEEMRRRIRAANLLDLRFRDRIATAVRFRIEAITDKEAVRRGSALFSLPHLRPMARRRSGARRTRSGTALGDVSDDYNWYTKRATLSGVYGATVLFWLGDESADHRDTWAFLDRRIEDVMRIEKVKAEVRKNPAAVGSRLDRSGCCRRSSRRRRWRGWTCRGCRADRRSGRADGAAPDDAGGGDQMTAPGGPRGAVARRGEVPCTRAAARDTGRS